MICSSSNTHKLVMLSKIDGLNINSTKNELQEKPSVGNNLDATFANKFVSELLDLGIKLMLKARNILIMFHTSF